MAELLEIANAMFKDKSNWSKITDFDKERHFFIFNRFFSKKYPSKAQLLNDKLINKVSAMDTWYLYMLNEPYPKWFWSKSESKSKNKADICEDEILELLKEWDLKKEDFEILIKYYPKIVDEEIKYLRDARNPSKY